MKRCRTKADRFLLGAAIAAGAVYLAIFITAFSDLPLRISPPHQLLLLGFHAIPLFCWQLLLCRTAKGWRRIAPPLLALAVPVLVFVAVCGFQTMAWYLAAIWAAAPLAAVALAWLAWLVGRLYKQRRG